MKYEEAIKSLPKAKQVFTQEDLAQIKGTEDEKTALEAIDQKDDCSKTARTSTFGALCGGVAVALYAVANVGTEIAEQLGQNVVIPEAIKVMGDIGATAGILIIVGGVLSRYSENKRVVQAQNTLLELKAKNKQK